MLTLLSSIYWILLLLVAATVPLLVWGWRARKLDDHPLCRRCGYDLFGLPQPLAACPECGADVSQPGLLRIGHRTRHKPAIRMALVLIALLGAAAYLINWRYDVVYRRPAQFKQALALGNLQEMDRLLALHPEFAHGQFYTGLTSNHAPIHRAVLSKSDPVVKRLIAAGVDPDTPTDRGETPLQFAIEYGQPSTVSLLLAAHADPNLPGREGKPPLYSAAELGKLSVVEDLLKAGAKIDAMNAEGRAALHAAAKQASWSVIAALLEAGADVHARDGQGRTPLHETFARVHDAHDFSLLLLNRGARLTARDHNGLIPGMPPANMRHRTSIRQETVVTVWWHQLQDAQQRGAMDEAAAWLEAAPEVLTADAGYNPATLLQRAVRAGEVELVRLLLEKGADPNLADQQIGTAALHELASTGRANGRDVRPLLMELLLEAGADVNARDGQGRSALHLVVRHAPESLPLIRRLLLAGAKVDLRDAAGSPPCWNRILQRSTRKRISMHHRPCTSPPASDMSNSLASCLSMGHRSMVSKRASDRALPCTSPSAITATRWFAFWWRPALIWQPGTDSATARRCTT